MSEPTRIKPGHVGWQDLTVPNAEQVRDFYTGVIGWRSEPVDMGEYADFNMIPHGSETPAAGICHARGPNADLPPQWLLYFVVENVDEAAARCTEQGGSVISGPRGVGGGRFCVIRDPAGAVCGLYQYGG